MPLQRSEKLGWYEIMRLHKYGHRYIVRNVELTGSVFVEHALAADDEGDHARHVAATDSTANLAR